MFGLGLYIYAGEDLPEDAAPQPEGRAAAKQPKNRDPLPRSRNSRLFHGHLCPVTQPIKRVKLKDSSIMQAAEFAATHEDVRRLL